MDPCACACHKRWLISDYHCRAVIGFSRSDPLGAQPHLTKDGVSTCLMVAVRRALSGAPVSWRPATNLRAAAALIV